MLVSAKMCVSGLRDIKQLLFTNSSAIVTSRPGLKVISDDVPSQVILDDTNTAVFMGSVVYLLSIWLGTCVLLFLCLVQSQN